MIFISYFTKNTPYEKVMNTHLLPSLQKWDLKYDIQAVEDLKNWNSNTRYKAKLIKEALIKYKEDVCFLDADATIESYPDLLFNIPKEYDIALHQLDWFLFWRNEIGNKHRELLSGTMIIKYSEKNLKLIDQWILKDENDIHAKEQKNLEELIIDNPNYKIHDLPASYCAIIKRDGSIPKYIGKPIILHHQVSRLYKNFKR